MRSSIDCYCHEVKKHLMCDWSTRKSLIQGLRSELQDHFSECASYEEILSGYGAPEMIAHELQEAVDLPEYHTAFQKKKRLMILLTVLVISVCIGITAGYLHEVANSKIVSKQDTIIIDGTFPNDGTIIDFTEE